jgi:hypothetical protein
LILYHENHLPYSPNGELLVVTFARRASPQRLYNPIQYIPAQEPTMKYLIYVFYLEILINFASGGQSLFMPAAFLGQFSSEPAPAFALEMTRWYGVLIAVLTYLLIRGLMLRGTTLKVALEALLFGDVIQIIVSFVTANALGGWTSNVVLSVVVSVILGVVRVICLWKPMETGIEK